MASPAVVNANEAPRRSIAACVHDPVQIAGYEWRWLVIVSCILVAASLAPLFLSAAATGPDWAFMGVTHNYQDAATYLSKMRIGYDGGWLLQFMHTPETHDGALMVVLYVALGHVARITGLDLVVVYQLARVIASLAMYISLYVLGSVLWTQAGTRRLFLIIAALGAGFGWLAAPLTGRVNFPDLAIPEMFPFYSSLVNAHFPLAIAALALLAAQFVLVIRPTDSNTPLWPVLGTMLLALALTFLYPQGLVPFAGAVVIYLAHLRLRTGSFPRGALLHTVAMIAPAVPMALYIGLVVRLNPAFAEWNRQNVTLSPPLWLMLVGLGLPLLLGVPALARAARRLDRDGDRLMLWWLIMIGVAMFLPTNVQRRFGVGLMIPVAFFAVRALRDFWLPRLGKRAGNLLLATALLLMTLTTIMTTIVPVVPLLAGAPEERLGIVLPVGYRGAMDWLNNHAAPGAVVLAAPEASAWIPGMTGTRVVYGHAFETLDAETKLAQVTAWYTFAAGDDCQALLEEFAVRYVLFGPLEAALGQGACLEGMTGVASYDNVIVYAAL
ncbi:MAG TPA: hypothetical protein VER79_13395 [Candidatus Limnocylindrales bacterium]|nr:hypothetical protein [Candidatus Limnocylindrales bacterium]